MGKGLLFSLMMSGLMIASLAQAESRFDELVDLHKVGPISAQVHAQKDDVLQFVCFGKDHPNRPVHVTIGYRGVDKSVVQAVAYDAMTEDSLELAHLIDGRNFPLEISHIPAFDGQLLAGRAMWQNALAVSDDGNVRVGISMHEPSQKRLAIVFKIKQDNNSNENPESCQLKEQIAFACIESAVDL